MLQRQSTKADRKRRTGHCETNLCRGKRRARSSVLPQHAGIAATFEGQTAAWGLIRPVLPRHRSGLHPCQLASFLTFFSDSAPLAAIAKGCRLGECPARSAVGGAHDDLKDSAMISLRLPLPTQLRACGRAAAPHRGLDRRRRWRCWCCRSSPAAGSSRRLVVIRAARRPIRWSPGSTASTSGKATSRWPRTISAPNCSSCRRTTGASSSSATSPTSCWRRRPPRRATSRTPTTSSSARPSCAASC